MLHRIIPKDFRVDIACEHFSHLICTHRYRSQQFHLLYVMKVQASTDRCRSLSSILIQFACIRPLLLSSSSCPRRTWGVSSARPRAPSWRRCRAPPDRPVAQVLAAMQFPDPRSGGRVGCIAHRDWRPYGGALKSACSYHPVH